MSGELAIRDERSYLAAVDEIRGLVERIEQVSDAKGLADRARAAQVWAERQRLGQDHVNLAIAARFWAARREGELLIELRENGERVAGGPGFGTESSGATLRDLAIDKHESSRVQKLAMVDVDRYEKIIADCIAAGRLNFREFERRVDRAEREAAGAAEEQALREGIAARGGPSWSIEHADLRDFDPGPVDAILADPPYKLEFYCELREFAVRTLKLGGPLAAMTSVHLLADVMRVLMIPGLRYRWTIAWVSGAHESTADQLRRVYDRWKPVVVYHRGTWRADTPMLTDIVVSGRDEEKGLHPWQQSLAGFRQLVRAVSRPGDVICDPFVGAGTTALAALAEDRSFVGCDVDVDVVATAKARLAA